jgi:hypothetical protein
MNPCEQCEISGNYFEDPVWIPAPARIRGCLISRDPTVRFPEAYKDYKNIAIEKGLLAFDAPPAWLCNNIRKFIGLEESSPDLRKLRYFLNRETYWTHLLKCPTCKAAAKTACPYHYLPFNSRRAKMCADFWFGKEFQENKLLDTIIITLGMDVKQYFSQWLQQHREIDLGKVISLPHPSPANVGTGWSWNKKSSESGFVKGEVERLLDSL